MLLLLRLVESTSPPSSPRRSTFDSDLPAKLGRTLVSKPHPSRISTLWLQLRIQSQSSNLRPLIRVKARFFSFYFSLSLPRLSGALVELKRCPAGNPTLLPVACTIPFSIGPCRQIPTGSAVPHPGTSVIRRCPIACQRWVPPYIIIIIDSSSRDNKGSNRILIKTTRRKMK